DGMPEMRGAEFKVHVVGRRSSPRVQEYRDFLQRNGVAFRWVELERDPLVRLLSDPRTARGARSPGGADRWALRLGAPAGRSPPAFYPGPPVPICHPLWSRSSTWLRSPGDTPFASGASLTRCYRYANVNTLYRLRRGGSDHA